MRIKIKLSIMMIAIVTGGFPILEHILYPKRKGGKK